MIPQATAPAPATLAGRAAWRPADFATRSGIRIAVFTAGRVDPGAPTLVLVHGMGHWTQAAWDGLAASFSATHRIVAFDLPGFGDSDRPDVAYALPFFSAVLAEVVAAFAPGPIALVGHSLGGLIAGTFASERPEAVRFLGLIDPAGFLRTPALVLKIVGSRPVVALLGKMRPSRAFVRKTFASAVFDTTAIREDQHERAYALSQDPSMRRAFASVYANSMRAFVRIDELHARLAAYRGPALLVWGREDRFVPFAGLAVAQRVYPQAGVLAIDACGHCPNIEFPELVAARLLAAGA